MEVFVGRGRTPNGSDEASSRLWGPRDWSCAMKLAWSRRLLSLCAAAGCGSILGRDERFRSQAQRPS
jgi:hypothetical protein